MAMVNASVYIFKIWRRQPVDNINGEVAPSAKEVQTVELIVYRPRITI